MITISFLLHPPPIAYPLNHKILAQRLKVTSHKVTIEKIYFFANMSKSLSYAGDSIDNRLRTEWNT